MGRTEGKGVELKETEKKNNTLTLLENWKKTIEHENESDINCN